MNPLVCHRRRPRCASIIGLLDAGVSGRQDHTISPSVSAPLVGRRFHVHRIPASRVVTTAIRPSSIEAGCGKESTVFEKEKGKYFYEENLNDPTRLIPRDKFVRPHMLCGKPQGPT